MIFDNDKAFPSMVIDPNNQFEPGHAPGLTKREHFAGLFMQGILANTNYDAPRRNKLDEMAEDALHAADALIKALAEDK